MDDSRNVLMSTASLPIASACAKHSLMSPISRRGYPSRAEPSTSGAQMHSPSLHLLRHSPSLAALQALKASKS
eukprot:2683780-Alexandrium_andersonii.AAC.1